MRATISFMLLIFTASSAYGVDVSCDPRAKEGSWQSIDVHHGFKRTPVPNLLAEVSFGIKTLAWRLDKLPISASRQEIVDTVGEKPHQEIPLGKGTAKLTWISESMGKVHYVSVFIYRSCISEIQLQSIERGNLKSQIMLEKDNILPQD